MRCEDARGDLLEADRAVLEGIGDDPLARHVRACPRCGRIGRFILREEAALEDSLRLEVPPPDLDAVLTRALVGHPPDPPVLDSRGSRIARYLLRPRGLMPLAAVAATMILIFGRPPSLPGPPYSPPATPQGVAVQTPLETNVVVLETQDPDIVVVWLY